MGEDQNEVAVVKKRAKLNILAIDPALSVMGWAILQYNPKNPERIEVNHAGIYKPSQVIHRVAYNDYVRAYGFRNMCLLELRKNVKELLITYTPEYVVLEDVFFSFGTPSAFMPLAQAITVIDSLLLRHSLLGHRVSTKQAKKFTAGSGASLKDGVESGLHLLADLKIKDGLLISNKGAHATDAIAVGYTFIKNTLPGLLLEQANNPSVAPDLSIAPDAWPI